MSARGLRFSGPDDMPPAMRRLYQQALASVPRPTTPTPLQSPPSLVVAAKPRKYRNEVVVVDGIRFDSKREAKHYEYLKLCKAAGDLRYFLRQVPLHLPGGTRLVVDFVEFWADGSVRYRDAKGVETKEFKIKRREIQAHYPIQIELV
ncbi:MAG: DUF1064 domain-containing protein [Lysobacter sp.]